MIPGRAKLIKLDKRYAGYPTWKYYVERPYTFPVDHAKHLFYEWREWCWREWGPSKELQEYDNRDLFDGLRSSNPHWCWLVDRHRIPRIYLRTDEDASAFSLRWL